jgi:hypothetical protein
MSIVWLDYFVKHWYMEECVLKVEMLMKVLVHWKDPAWYSSSCANKTFGMEEYPCGEDKECFILLPCSGFDGSEKIVGYHQICYTKVFWKETVCPF